MSDNQQTTSNQDYNHKINNNDYTYKVTIITAAGNLSRAQDIKPANIQNLYIEHSLNETFQRGYIVINNSHDAIERDTPQIDPQTNPAYYNNIGNTADNNNSGVNGDSTSNIDAGFLFRGESRDILHIEIMPKLDGDSAVTNSLGPDDGQKFFRMTHDFAIYDTEEIAGASPDQKYKKLYFWDLYYQLLQEKNVYFSTTTIAQTGSSNAPLTNNADNSDRAISTGVAIREFLKTAFPPNEQYPIAFSVNIPGTQNTAKLTQGDIDNSNIDWDIGGTNIFFSTPANYKAIDCLNYLLARHVSNANSSFDQCLLRLNRYPREFTLKSLKQYFDQAYNPTNDSPGSLYLETVKIGGYVQQDGKDNTLPYFTPANGALYFERVGTIKSFTFDSMPGIISQQKNVSQLVHSYDYENKQFQIDIQRNGIEQAMKTYQQNYVNNMNSSNQEPAFPNFAPGQLRYLNKNVNNVFSVTEQDADQRLAWGRNKFLYASVISNNLISFRLPGSTHRQAGYFIGIDRDGSVPNSKFDNKLLGIYLIVQVKHLFNGNEYYNDLHCIKTYNFKPLDDTYTDKDADGNLTGLVSNGQ